MTAPNPDATLQQWLADEEATRQRQRANAQPSMGGVAMPAQLANLSGLAAMQAMLAGKLPLAPIFHTMDFLLVEVAAGHAVYQGEPLYHHLNPMGGIHGGWYATVLDSALGCAVHTMLTPEETYTTLELKVNMVRPLTDAVPLVRAEGKVIHTGRQVATAEGRIVGPDGKLYAHATTTCLIFDQRAPG